MSLTQSAERAALNKLIDYLDSNPQENIDKIMDLINKLVPTRYFLRSAPPLPTSSRAVVTGTTSS